MVIRSESSIALAMTKKSSWATESLNYIASEMALLLGNSSVIKLLPNHVPGKLNTEADWLSRLGD